MANEESVQFERELVEAGRRAVEAGLDPTGALRAFCEALTTWGSVEEVYDFRDATEDQRRWYMRGYYTGERSGMVSCMSNIADAVPSDIDGWDAHEVALWLRGQLIRLPQ